MRYHPHILILLLASLIGGGRAIAQDLPVASDLPMNGKEARYLGKADNQALIYAGELEATYSNQLEGHPYLETNEYRAGTLSFDNILYPNVQMRLNVHSENLILLTPDRRLPIVVPSDRIDFARFPDYDVFYAEPLGEKGALAKGFYARLHDGTCSLWKRTTKGLERWTNERILTQRFVEKTAYYICKGDGVFHPVNNKRTFMKLFKEHKRQLSRYMKSQGLSFRKDKELTLKRLIDYAETLDPR